MSHLKTDFREWRLVGLDVQNVKFPALSVAYRDLFDDEARGACSDHDSDLFDKSFIESALKVSFICWYHSLGVKNKTAREKKKEVTICSKTIHCFRNTFHPLVNNRFNTMPALCLSVGMVFDFGSSLLFRQVVAIDAQTVKQTDLRGTFCYCCCCCCWSDM